MRRVWLDPTTPCLAAAADWLVGRAAGDDDDDPALPLFAGATRSDGAAVCDLQRTVCVLPGRRAGRGLLVALAERCTEDGLTLAPPPVVTPGALAETLLAVEGPLAAPVERRLAWMRALDAAPPPPLAPLLATPPGDPAAGHRLAKVLAGLVEELDGELVGAAEMAEHADAMLMHGEADRWRTIAALHESARRLLEAAGLADPGAALAAALEAGRVDAADVVLVAVTDLNRRERRLVEALGDRATALVVAGADTRDRFDALGCVRPDAWRDAPIEIGDDEVVVADRPIDQGQAVLHAMAALDGDVGPGSITIALGDESLAPTLMRAGTTAGVRFHHAAGAPLARSAPARLLASVADWIEHRSYPALAALVRHPDVEQWLRRVTAARRPEDAGHDWIAELDRSFDAHRPARLGDRWPGRDARAGRIRWGLGVIDRWLRPLGGPPAPLGTWPDRILAVLREVYGGAEIATARRQPLEAAATALRDGLRAVSSAPASLQPPTDGLSALRVCLHEMETVAVPVEPHGDEVEMLGWLEVALDPAPVVVVTGFNDGHVPGAVNADAFLPEGLRERAGLLGNARRFARDAWILDTVRRGRRATLVAGRRSAEGEPLTPSRLLLAGADRARRVLALADERAVFAPPRGIGVPAPVETSTFTVPAAPTEGVELDRISVTDFRRYLQCPFRYWLERVLRLEAVDDTADELDALRFGTLAHGVLQDFGEDPDVRDLDDPDRIESFLLAALDARAADAFGDLPAPAVRIQIARLRRRLSVFAARQAARRRAGWRIERAEHVLPETARLDVPGQADVRVTGKVDRVDRHEETGAWLVIDYKTGEKARTPEKAHRDGARWTDLQLPLYRHLLAADGVDGEVGLAYFCLPGTLKEIEILEAGWSPEEIDEAVDVARGVVRDIRAGKFERNPDFPLHYRDAFETICQTRVFGAGEELEWAGADA